MRVKVGNEPAVADEEPESAVAEESGGPAAAVAPPPGLSDAAAWAQPRGQSSASPPPQQQQNSASSQDHPEVQNRLPLDATEPRLLPEQSPVDNLIAVSQAVEQATQPAATTEEPEVGNMGVYCGNWGQGASSALGHHNVWANRATCVAFGEPNDRSRGNDPNDRSRGNDPNDRSRGDGSKGHSYYKVLAHQGDWRDPADHAGQVELRELRAHRAQQGLAGSARGSADPFGSQSMPPMPKRAPPRPSPPMVPTSAVAVGPSPTMVPTSAVAAEIEAAQKFDLEFFQNFKDWTGTYKQHSAALKWFRDSLEAKGAIAMAFSNTLAEQVPEIVHEGGTNYSFNMNIHKPWHWLEMVAQLDDESMRVVVEGSDNRSRGAEAQSRRPALIACSIEQMDKYDHRRHHADMWKNVPDMLKEWDFVVVRDDGTYCCLHPSWSKARADCKFGKPVKEHEIPASGLGGTGPAGTFKRLVGKGVDMGLRFDATKKPPNADRSRGAPQSRSTGPAPP